MNQTENKINKHNKEHAPLKDDLKINSFFYNLVKSRFNEIIVQVNSLSVYY